MRTTAVLTLRNEAAFLLEWLAHHRAVGFTDFLVFTNDCDDGTDAMLDRLAELGGVAHVPNPGPYDEAGVQWTALKQADKHPLVREADWLMCLDIDEFVNIHAGDHTLDALRAALPQATAIPLTWRLFGNNGVVNFQDRNITQEFTRAAPAELHWPWRAAMIKTLYKNDGIYRKMGVHRPRSPDKSRLDQARWFDARGTELPEIYKTQKLFSPFGRDNYRLAQLNHYALGSMQSYLLKRARGRVNRGADLMGMDYWCERNFNQEVDESIAALAPRSAPILAELKSDPILADLHKQSVAWRRQEFDRLILDDDLRALFGRLLMTPPSQPLAPKMAQALLTIARKSQQ